MNNKPTDQESFRTLQLMDELKDGGAVSQRELAERLGVAVGLINSYLKNFIAKGFVRVKAYPRNRYAYLLTPKGFSEKSRLAYQHLSYFTGLYTTTRQSYLELFKGLAEQGVKGVVFVGVDEVAEIAYLSLQEVGLKLHGVADQANCGKLFFGIEISPLEGVYGSDQMLVVTSLKRGASLDGALVAGGVDPRFILRAD